MPTERERGLPLGGQAPEIVRDLVNLVDGLVSASIGKRTATDFREYRNEVFPQYVSAVAALGTVTGILLSAQAIERLSVDSFSIMEADLREGETILGPDLTERGLFTVWVIRKIYDLAKEIECFEVPKERAADDAAKAHDFVFFGLWNRFHVDCLLKAIRSEQPIFPDVVDPIRDGLRAAVDTYAHVRQWAEIRNPPIAERDFPEISFSDEDAAWVADSEQELGLEAAK